MRDFLAMSRNRAYIGLIVPVIATPSSFTASTRARIRAARRSLASASRRRPSARRISA